MNKFFNVRLNKYEYEIYSGEYFVTKEQNIVITTLLGSCIAVCMKDSFSSVAGINHYLLPDSKHRLKEVRKNDSRYGINAMQLMIEGMIKLGASRSSLQAKVFGGGQAGDDLNNVSKSNIEFVFNYLNQENIPVLAQDVGGRIGRKIFFFPSDFKVLLKRISFQNQLSQEELIIKEKKQLQLIKQLKGSDF